MATPIGHTLAGLMFSRHHADLATPRRRLAVFAYFILFANLPDFDFIPGLLVGDPSAFHRGITHTVFFAALMSAVAFAAFAARGRQSGAWWGGATFACIGSHLFLDYLTAGPGSGLALMWPLSDRLFYPASPIIEPLRSVSFSADQIRIVGRETALVIGALFLRDAYVEIRFGRMGVTRTLSQLAYSAARPIASRIGAGAGFATAGLTVFFGAAFLLNGKGTPPVVPTVTTQEISGNGTGTTVSYESLSKPPLPPAPAIVPANPEPDETEPVQTVESLANSKV